jgi:hypothetical protein
MPHYVQHFMPLNDIHRQSSKAEPDHWLSKYKAISDVKRRLMRFTGASG